MVLNKSQFEFSSFKRFTIVNPKWSSFLVFFKEVIHQHLSVYIAHRNIFLIFLLIWLFISIFWNWLLFAIRFGINGEPTIQQKWEHNTIKDDKVGKQSNVAKTISFATAGEDTRTTQLFVNFHDNAFLDKSGFTPVGKVIQGFDVLLKLYADYGEGAPDGRGPEQGKIVNRGNAYLKENFPKLSFVSDIAVAESK